MKQEDISKQLKRMLSMISVDTQRNIYIDGKKVNKDKEKRTEITDDSFLTNLEAILYLIYIGKSEKEEKRTNFFHIDAPNDSFNTNSGWKRDKIDNLGNVILSKGSKKISIKSGQYHFNEVTPDNGSAKVFYRVGTDLNALSVIFLHGKTFSNEDTKGYVRLYFNLVRNPSKIFQFIQSLEYRLNECLIPFKLKFRRNIFDFKFKSSNGRSDSCVLYLEYDYFVKAIWIVLELVKMLQTSLNNEVPYFVYKIAPGVGFGESPLDSIEDSFGSFRTGKIAKYITSQKPWQKPQKSLVYLLPGLLCSLEKVENFNLKAFFRSPNTHFFNNLPLYNRNENFFFSEPAKQGGLNNGKEKYLNAAMKIAFIICNEALWISKNKCNWVSIDKINKNKYKALDESIYYGRLGIAFFLSTILNFRYNPLLEQTALSASEKSNIKEVENISFSDSWVKQKESVGLFKNVAQLNFLTENTFQPKKFKDFTSNDSFDLDFPKIIPTLKNEQSDDDKTEAEKTGNRLITYLDDDKPLQNNFGNDLFCPTLADGLSGYGYFFLRLYAPEIVRPLPKLS